MKISEGTSVNQNPNHINIKRNCTSSMCGNNQKINSNQLNKQTISQKYRKTLIGNLQQFLTKKQQQKRPTSITSRSSRNSSSGKQRKSKYFLNLKQKTKNHPNKLCSNENKENSMIRSLIINDGTQNANYLNTYSNQSKNHINQQSFYLHTHRSYRSNKQTTCNNSSSFLMNINDLSGNFIGAQSNTMVMEENKYERIRLTMKKLKNLTEVKISKPKKSQRVSTSPQQWTHIEKIVNQVCNNSFTQEYTEKTQFQEQQQKKIDDSTKKNKEKMEELKKQDKINEVKIQDSSIKKTNFIEQEKKPQPELKDMENNIVKNEKEKSEKILQKDKNLQQKNQAQQVCPKNQNQAKKVNIQQVAQNQQIKQTSSFKQFLQFYSFLALFENVFHNMDYVLHEMTLFCQASSIKCQQALLFFYNHLYLSRLLLQISLKRLPTNFKLGKQVHDFAEVFEQIKEDNLIVFNYRSQFCKANNLSTKQQFDYLNLTRNSEENAYQNKSYDLIEDYLEEERAQFIGFNLRLLRKVLKLISKKQETNQNEFRVFLNFSASFLNMVQITSVIGKINSEQMLCQYREKIRQSDEQLMKQQFLYKDCGLIRIEYLDMTDRQFQKEFADAKRHKNIQAYYQLLIKELKLLESKHKQSRTKTDNNNL